MRTDLAPQQPPAPDFPSAFDPLSFFAGRTTGHAVVRGPGGRLLARCRMETLGEVAEAQDALHFDEIYTFDDGRPTDRMHWAVVRTPGGFEATELSVPGRLRSQLSGSEWRVRFTRRPDPPAGGPRLDHDARFSLVADDLVLKQVKVSLLGVPLAVLIGHHRRV